MITPDVQVTSGYIAALCYGVAVLGSLLISLIAAALYTGLTWRSR